MDELVIIAPLMPLVIGASFSRIEFPRHLTLVPPFRVRCGIEEVSAALGAVASDTETLQIAVIGLGLFGPDKDIAVALVDPTLSIVNAHLRLVGALLPLGWNPQDPDYNGEGYRPHITFGLDGSVLIGEHFRASEIALVEMLDLPVVRASHSLAREKPHSDQRSSLT